MNREGAGVFVILAGIIVIIGAAKGTWRQLWTDVTGQNVPAGSAANQSPGSVSGIFSIPILGGILGNTPQGLAIQAGQVIGVLPRDYQIPGGGQLQPVILPYYPGSGQSGAGVVTAQ